MSTIEVSSQFFIGKFNEKKDLFGFRVPLDEAKKYNPSFDVEAKLSKIPQQYLNNLASLDLATQEGDFYEIKEKKIRELMREFAPTLIFDSKEQQSHQLGNLVSYFMDLFSKQYALIQDNPPEEYKKFVELWKKHMPYNGGEFLHFLDELINQEQTPLPKTFFQEAIKETPFSIAAKSIRIYVNFIPGHGVAIIQYFTFYPKNDQNQFFSLISKIISCTSKVFPPLKKYKSISFHLGDWERVDVYLAREGKQFRQVGMTYSGHGSANIHKTTGFSNHVFVAEGGHATRPSSFPIDLMLDRCDGAGIDFDLKERHIQFFPISLHNLLLDNSLETKCLLNIPKHGPKGSPDSPPLQRCYAQDPSLLEFVRRNRAWQPKQPVVGWLWNKVHPPIPNPHIAEWDGIS